MEELRWVETNDNAPGNYNSKIQIKFKTTILNSSYCDYNDGYILVKGTKIIVGEENNDAAKLIDQTDKALIFKSYGPFTIHWLYRIEYWFNRI